MSNIIENCEKNLTIEEIYTVLGIFVDGYILTPSGRKYNVMMYNSLRNSAEGIFGWYNIEYNKDLESWIAFQFMEY